MFTKFSKRPARAFTLVEIMVSVTIFTIVMLAATGAYLNLISLDRQTRAVNDVVDNLNFAMDSMARNIRTGTNYQCGGGGGGNCWTTPSSVFTFVNDQNQQVTYLLRSDGTLGQCTVITCTAATASQFTDPRVHIDTLSFYVRGVGSGDNLQPEVVFVVHGTLATDGQHAPTSFSLQTTASERGIEL